MRGQQSLPWGLSGIVAGAIPAIAATTSSGVLFAPNLSANANEDASYPRVIQLPAGTILAVGTAWNHGDYTQQAVEVFASTNQGASWSYRSSCTPAPDLTRPCRSPSTAASSLSGSHSWQQP
jgi:hypothetical protein